MTDNLIFITDIIISYTNEHLLKFAHHRKIGSEYAPPGSSVESQKLQLTWSASIIACAC